MQRVQVGNRQCVAVLFVILVVIDVYGHRFEVFTIVSEIHDYVDLVLGMKNMFELEGVRHVGLILQIPEQINTLLFKRTDITKPKRKEVCKNRSTIYR